MSSTMRAKLKIQSIKPYPEEGQPTQETLTFAAVSKSERYPEDGSDEDNTFAKFSPSASLTISIANPNLIGKFAVGETYYVDFTPVEPAAPAA